MKNTFLLLIFVSFLFSCDSDTNMNEEQQIKSLCQQSIVINANDYANTSISGYISQLNFSNDCMKVEYASSGCDGSTFVAKLVTDGNVDYTTNPVSRVLKLNVESQELCAAVFKKQTSFDATSLQVAGKNEVRLVIEDLNSNPQTFIYQY